MLTTKARLEGVQERKGGEELETASKDHSFKVFCCSGKETLII